MASNRFVRTSSNSSQIPHIFFGLKHGRYNYEDTKSQMSSLLVFNRVYRLERQLVMLVFSTQLCEYCPSTITLVYLSHPSPLPKVNIRYINTDIMWLGGDGGC
jgi:hypothetical protein